MKNLNKLNKLSKLNIKPNVKNKRIAAMFPLGRIGAVLLFLFLVPYVISGMFGNVGIEETLSEILTEGSIFVENTTNTGVEKIPLELYIADKLSRTMTTEYEEEALKAQAVLIRTALMAELYELKTKELKIIPVNDEGYGRGEIKNVFFEATAATQGVCARWKGEFIKASYFAVSNGATRNAGEVIPEQEHHYLKSVLCSRDFLSDYYLSKVSVSKSEFSAILEKNYGFTIGKSFQVEEFTLIRDSVGYVLNVEHDAIGMVSGESFRESLGLASSCFQLEEVNGKIEITVKGVGHGLGMSQYAANEMAKEDCDYIEILCEFFDEIELTKIE